MTTLEIISRLCDVTNILSDIVKKQQETIRQSSIEEAVKDEFGKVAKEAERKLDVIEYHTRRYCDIANVITVPCIF